MIFKKIEGVMMPEFTLNYFCNVCGHKNEIGVDVPIAPKMVNASNDCENCNDCTHLLITTCPECKGIMRYFQSDLDFPKEIEQLSGTYVKIISGIKDSLVDVIDEFNVPTPKRWAVKLECSCGKEFIAEIPLPQL